MAKKQCKYGEPGCPGGKKIRSKGQGQGKGYGQGKGPLGRHKK